MRIRTRLDDDVVVECGGAEVDVEKSFRGHPGSAANTKRVRTDHAVAVHSPQAACLTEAALRLHLSHARIAFQRPRQRRDVVRWVPQQSTMNESPNRFHAVGHLPRELIRGIMRRHVAVDRYPVVDPRPVLDVRLGADRHETLLRQHIEQAVEMRHGGAVDRHT